MSFDIAKSVAKNTAYMMGSQAVTWMSSLVLILMLPRYLGSEDYGRLYLALSVAMIAQIVIDFGGPYYITKEVSRDRKTISHLMVNSIVIRIVIWLISLGAMAGFAYAVGYTPVVISLILIFGATKLWEGARRVMVSCFQGFEMMQYPSLGSIAERVFVAAVGAAALLMGADVVTIAVIMAASTLLNFLVVMKFTPRIASSLPRWEWATAVGQLKRGIPYFLWSLFAVVYYRIDAVMLSLFSPEAVVGWYGAAYRLFDALMFLPHIFSIAIFPVLSRLGANDKDRLERTTHKSIEVLIMTGVPIGIGIIMFARPIVGILFGLTEYGPSIPLIQIFAIALLIVYIDFILGSSLFASDRQRQWTVVAFLALLLNPLLNYFLIPYTQAQMANGGIGAAVATIITEVFVFGAALYYMPQGFLKGFRINAFLKIAGAGAMMVGVILCMRSAGMHWIAQGIAGPIFYGVFLLSVKGLEPSELAFIRRLMSPRRLKSLLVPAKEI